MAKSSYHMKVKGMKGRSKFIKKKKKAVRRILGG